MAGKKKKSEEPEESNLIMLMTISLFIILLAFFILLNAIGVVDEHKKIAAIGSLLGSFGGPGGGSSLIKGGGGDANPPPFSTENGANIDFSILSESNTQEGQSYQIKTTPRATTVTFEAGFLFFHNSDRIRPEAHTTLKNLGKIINENDLPIDIAGYTDNSPLYDPGHSTLRELSGKRALSLFKFLSQTGHVPPRRMTPYGWGPYYPEYSNKTPETRALNNRIAVVFSHKRASQKPKGLFEFKEFIFKVFKS